MEGTLAIVALIHQGDQSPHAVIMAAQAGQLALSGGHQPGRILRAPGDAALPGRAAQRGHIAEKEGLEFVTESDVGEAGPARFAAVVAAAPEQAGPPRPPRE